MSVFTRVDRHTLERFLAGFDSGRLTTFKGISEGIENTNYFVTTDRGEFVLTLVEQWEADEVPYFVELMGWLAARGVPSARPIADRAGRTLHTLLGRPAALVERLVGESTEEPTRDDCDTVGHVLARLHRAGAEFGMHRTDHRGLGWRRRTAELLYPELGPDNARILRDEIDHHASRDWRGLPTGVVHADLFPDNVLFRKGRITGVIDFYYACNDLLIYDIAITVNQWCTTADGALDRERAQAILGAYHAERALQAAEREAWPHMLRYAALRFWISRLKDKLFPKEGHLTTIKEPDDIRIILIDRRGKELELLDLWDEALAGAR
jgi:homoserine kinase type II